MKIAIAEDVEVKDPNGGLQVRDGSSNIQRLLDDDAPDGFNFWFVRSNHVHEGDAAFQTPRHHHTFAQIKYTERGSSDIGLGQYIHAGDIGYFPRSAYYGPQHKESCALLALQFGFNGEHQRGEAWEKHRPEAMQRLKSRGIIENGLYIETDPTTGAKTTRDSVEALYDERYQMLTGKNLVVGPGGYENPVVMHPQAFSYFQLQPGVEVKRLGAFFDQPGPNGDVSISMLRFTKGGPYRLRPERPQLVWSIAEGLVVDGQRRPALTCVYSPRGDTGEIAGEGGVEAFVVEFPRLD